MHWVSELIKGKGLDGARVGLEMDRVIGEVRLVGRRGRAAMSEVGRDGARVGGAYYL